jgi:ATP-dependent Clp protease protease subunit
MDLYNWQGAHMAETKQNENFGEGMTKMLVGSEIHQQALKRREIFLWGAVDDDSAREVVQKLLYFDGIDQTDITMYVNSPGGMISSGLAIYDAMQLVKSDVVTVCMGQAASMGAVLLCAGTAGKRKAWANARVLIHQPLISGNMYGPASDLQIQAEEMLRLRQRLNEILAKHTKKPLSKLEQDTDRDFFMSAEESKEYGIVDEVVGG